MNEECEKIILEKENQIKEGSKFQKKFIVCEEALTVMEKKVEVSTKLIKTLQMENGNLKKYCRPNLSKLNKKMKYFWKNLKMKKIIVRI